MQFLSSIIPSLLVLGILIIIHEFGHFIACRLTGVKVEKFSIGFGPEIFHWQTKNTRYVVSLLPLGGFVKPAGESVSETESGVPQPGDYLAASVFSRILIVIAGVVMNYFLAFVLFAFIFMSGRPVPGTTVGTLVDGYPAKEAGLKVGDEIIQVGNTKVERWTDLISAIEAAPEGSVALQVLTPSADGSASQSSTIYLAPKVEEVKDIFGKPARLKRIGITPSPKSNIIEKYSFIDSVKHAGLSVVNLTYLTHKAIFYLIMGKLSMKTISGPIGIISMTGSAVHLGLPYLLQLTANLSISLAVINLFPIPGLDGGHLFFLLIEAVTRKKVSLQFQEKATQIGFVFLLTFMGFAIFNDLNNLNLFAKLKALIPG